MARHAVIALLAAAAAATVFWVPPASPAAGTCTLFAGPHGRDDATGAIGDPFRTAVRLAAALPAGGVGCLSPGVYFGRVTVVRPVTLRGGGATIAGGITIGPPASGTVLQGLTIHGRGTARAAVIVRANGVVISGDTISGPGYENINSACILLDGSRGSTIVDSRIGSCTFGRPGGNVSAPGLLLGDAFGTLVANDVIAHTAGYGIVLGPNAQRTTVTDNIIDDNSGGVEIVGNAHTASSYNTIRDNIVENSTGSNVAASWTGYVGKHDTVVSNCLWGGQAGAAPGIVLTGNLAVDPGYLDASNVVTSGPCASKRPSIVGLRWRVMAPFHVGYHLRALSKRVQIVDLRLVGIAAGARVTASCVRSCSLRWGGAARSGTAVLASFAGKWLPVGATIDILVTSPWFVGASGSVVVTGLPHGVRVSHGCLPPGTTTPTGCQRFA